MDRTYESQIETPGPEELAELLPWYVNGTLQGPEREAVERALSCDLQLNKMYRELRSLSGVVLESEVLNASAAQSLAKLKARLQRPRPIQRKTGFHLAWLAAAAALAMMAGALWLAQPPSPAQFETLSDPAGVSASDKPRLRVVFSPDMTAQQVQLLVQRHGGRIVEGPSEFGVYTVEALETPDVEGWVGQWRNLDGVRFVELSIEKP